MKNLWAAPEKLACPDARRARHRVGHHVARGGGSMVEEVLPKGTLAVVRQVGHSVMTDNPQGFADAVCEFVLG